MSESILEMKKGAEQFYKNAFCAKSARVLPPLAKEQFKITGVIEIDSGDKRGIIHIAAVEKI